jgi:hypothetical protein
MLADLTGQQAIAVQLRQGLGLDQVRQPVGIGLDASSRFLQHGLVGRPHLHRGHQAQAHQQQAGPADGHAPPARRDRPGRRQRLARRRNHWKF